MAENNAIKAFGIDFTIDFLHTVIQAYPGKTVLSIGSGNAYFEHQYVTSHDTDIICIDPDPLSWKCQTLSNPFIEPTYPTVSDLLVERQDLIGDCIIILNWCPPNDSTFDHEAVLLLKPIAIFTVLEKWLGGPGAGGSIEFHNYLDRTASYKRVHVTKLNDSELDFQIQWWQLSRLPMISTSLPKYVNSRTTNYEPCCIS